MGSALWETWRAQASELRVHGLVVAAYDLGDDAAPSLTYLHGYPSASVDLAPVAERLDGPWRLLAVG